MPTTQRFGALLLLCALLVPTSLHAQSPRKRPARAAQPNRVTASHAFSLIPDFAFGQVKDETLARIRHQGFLPGLALRYDSQTPTWLHGGQLGFRYGQVSNRYDIPAHTGRFRWDYGTSYNVFRDTAWSIYAGGQLRGTNDVQFYPRVDESHLYWLTAYDLRATGHALYAWTRRTQFEAKLAVPFVALVSRPPHPRFYNNDKPNVDDVISRIHDNLDLTSLNAYFSAELSLAYRFIVTTSVAQSISYQFEYTRFADPKPIQLLSHALLLGLHVDPWGGF